VIVSGITRRPPIRQGSFSGLSNGGSALLTGFHLRA
jgi:hypothetical protein